MAISMKGRKSPKTVLKTDRKSNDSLSIENYINLHPEFVRFKQLEGLAERTISDHVKHFRYFTKWLKQSKRSNDNRFVSRGLFLEYKEYII